MIHSSAPSPTLNVNFALIMAHFQFKVHCLFQGAKDRVRKLILFEFTVVSTERVCFI